MVQRNRLYRDESFDLRKALIVALVVHLLLGVVAEYRPDLLWSAPNLQRDEADPLRFQFVDVPDSPTRASPPDTAAPSDRDRVARDASPRDDADTPFSRGNTEQRVLRAPAVPTPPAPAQQPIPESAPPATAAEAETGEPTASESRERLETETGELSRPGTEDPAETAAEDPTEASERPAEADAPSPESPRLPPERPDLSGSLARLESFVEPDVYSNPEGGADGPQGLVSFDTKGFDLGPYLQRILYIIERNWRSNIPQAARVPGMKGATFVKISIRREQGVDGREVGRLVVDRSWSSQVPVFDQAALFSLEISDPLPPIPDHFPYDRLDGRIGFLYNLSRENVSWPGES